jgi:hypothetical protein
MPLTAGHRFGAFAAALIALVAADLAGRPSNGIAAARTPVAAPIASAATASTNARDERDCFVTGQWAVVPGPGTARPVLFEVLTAASGNAAALPTLIGIVVGPEGRSAIFELSGVHLVVHAGDHVGTMLVEAIRPGEVVLRGPDGSAVWRVGNGTFTPSPEPAKPSQRALHSRGTDGQQHVE